MKGRKDIAECSTCSVFYRVLRKDKVDFFIGDIRLFLSAEEYSLICPRYLSECRSHFSKTLEKLFEIYMRRGVIKYYGGGNSGIRINWKKYRDSPNLNVLLLALGKLSLYPEDNWEIISLNSVSTDNRKCLNPCNGNFYFKEISNAVFYAKTRWPRSKKCLWELRKIENVHTMDMCYRKK